MKLKIGILNQLTVFNQVFRLLHAVDCEWINRSRHLHLVDHVIVCRCNSKFKQRIVGITRSDVQ